MGRAEQAQELADFIRLAKLSGWECDWVPGAPLGIYLSEGHGDLHHFTYWLYFHEQKGWVFQVYDPINPGKVVKSLRKVKFENGMKRLRKIVKEKK